MTQAKEIQSLARLYKEECGLAEIDVDELGVDG